MTETDSKSEVKPEVSRTLAFVLGTAQPRYLGQVGEEVPTPEFLKDAQAWRDALGLAREMGLLLPLCVVLSRASWRTEVPAAVQSDLERTLKNELISMAVLENEFENVLRKLIESKVHVLILGGSILQKDGDPHEVFKAVRSFDLMIAKEQISGAQRAVGRMGYRVVEDTSGMGGISLQRKLQSAVSGEQILSPIRFRWRVLEEDQEHDAAAIWERAVPEVSAEFPVGLKSMIPEDKLVQLIRHGGIERQLDSAVYLCEMDQIIRRTPNLDWARVHFMLERCQSQSAGAFMVMLLSRYWNSPIPKNVLDSIVKSVSAMKRRAFIKGSRLEDWFLPREREFSTQARAFYILNDHATSALKAAVQWRLHRKTA